MLPSLSCSCAVCELGTMFALECVNYNSISWNAQNITAPTVVCAEAAASQHLIVLVALKLLFSVLIVGPWLNIKEFCVCVCVCFLSITGCV